VGGTTATYRGAQKTVHFHRILTGYDLEGRRAVGNGNGGEAGLVRLGREGREGYDSAGPGRRCFRDPAEALRRKEV